MEIIRVYVVFGNAVVNIFFYKNCNFYNRDLKTSKAVKQRGLYDAFSYYTYVNAPRWTLNDGYKNKIFYTLNIQRWRDARVLKQCFTNMFDMLCFLRLYEAWCKIACAVLHLGCSRIFAFSILNFSLSCFVSG